MIRTAVGDSVPAAVTAADTAHTAVVEGAAGTAGGPALNSNIVMQLAVQIVVDGVDFAPAAVQCSHYTAAASNRKSERLGEFEDIARVPPSADLG